MNNTIIIISVVIFLTSVGYILYNTFFKKTNLLHQYIAIGLSLFMLVLIIFMMFSYKSNNIKTVSVKEANISDITFKQKRFDNDDLSSMSASDILNSYSEIGKDKLNNIFGDDDIAKNYALTLIGKTIPDSIFNDIDNKEVPLKKKSIVLVLNRGDESKKFIETINNIEFDNNTQYLILFPTESNKDVTAFIKDNKINEKWTIIAKENNDTTILQPDLFKVAKYYFNVIGTPSYVSVYDNTITLAGNGNSKDLFNKFHKNSFEQPFLFDLVEDQDDTKQSTDEKTKETKSSDSKTEKK